MICSRRNDGGRVRDQRTATNPVCLGLLHPSERSEQPVATLQRPGRQSRGRSVGWPFEAGLVNRTPQDVAAAERTSSWRRVRTASGTGWFGS